jgi:hypothetical protein
MAAVPWLVFMAGYTAVLLGVAYGWRAALKLRNRGR